MKIVVQSWGVDHAICLQVWQTAPSIMEMILDASSNMVILVHLGTQNSKKTGHDFHT